MLTITLNWLIGVAVGVSVAVGVFDAVGVAVKVAA
jgi:hypothetical protein